MRYENPGDDLARRELIELITDPVRGQGLFDGGQAGSLVEAVADLLALIRFLVPRTVHAGLTLGGDTPGLDGSSLEDARTFAATGVAARIVDEAQYAFGDGPCLHAMVHQKDCRVDSFATDTRWLPVSEAALGVGIRSSLSIPVLVDGQVRGAVNVYAEQSHAFPDEIHDVLSMMARPVAVVIRQLRELHAAQQSRDIAQDIAEALQRSLLPDLPAVPRVRMAARYRASGLGDVGGDWYDAFVLDDGVLALAIGDVMGHDLSATAAMGQVRSVLRSYSYEGHRPADVLDRVDRFVQRFAAAPLVTAIYARLVLDGGGAAVQFANAGHLPPLLCHPDGTVEILEHPSSVCIGVAPIDTVRRSERTVDLFPGSTLLFYTDGLVESRHRDIDDGIAAAAQLIATLPDRDPDVLCDHLLERLVGTRAQDDVALLAVYVEPP